MTTRTVTLRITGTSAELNAALTAAGLKADETATVLGDRVSGASDKAAGGISKLGNAVQNFTGIPIGPAADKMSAKFGQADTAGQKLGQTMSTVGGVALGAGVVGLAVFGEQSVKAASSFQSAMELIHTQAGASQAEVDKMSQAVLNLAGQTATAPNELAAGLYHLESSGMRGAAALQALKLAAEGAKVGHADLESVTNALNASIASGIPGVQNMQQAMGALNAIVGAGDMRMQDLADAMGTGVLAVVKGYGLSLNDVGAALATFGDNNIRGSDAATKLRVAVQAMSVPASTAKKALGEIGMTTTQLATDLQHGGLNQAITDLHDHLVSAGKSGVESGALLTEAFGKKAGPGIQILTDQFDRFQQKVKQVNDGAKGFGADYQATTHTLSFQMDSLKATVDALSIKFGMFLIPKLQEAARVVADVVNWFQKHKTVAEALGVVIGGVLAAAIAAFVVNMGVKFVKSVTSAVDALGSMAKKIPEFISGLGEAGVAEEEFATTSETTGTAASAAFGPIGLAIMAIVVIGTLIVTHWTQVKAALLAVWDGIKAAAVAVWDFIKAHLATIIEAIVVLVTGGVGLLPVLIYRYWDQIKAGVLTAWGDIVNFFTGIPGKIAGALSSLGSAIAGVATSAWNAFTGAVVAGWNNEVSFWTSLPGKVVSAIGSGLGVLEQWGKDLIQGIANGIVKAADAIGTALKNAVMGAVNAVKNTVNSIPVIGGALSAIGLATGGYVKQPTLALVGEAGPEFVIPEAQLRSAFDAGIAPLPPSLMGPGSSSTSPTPSGSVSPGGVPGAGSTTTVTQTFYVESPASPNDLAHAVSIAMRLAGVA